MGHPEEPTSHELRQALPLSALLLREGHHAEGRRRTLRLQVCLRPRGVVHDGVPGWHPHPAPYGCADRHAGSQRAGKPSGEDQRGAWVLNADARPSRHVRSRDGACMPSFTASLRGLCLLRGMRSRREESPL